MPKKKLDHVGNNGNNEISENTVYLDHSDKMIIQGYYYKRLFYENKIREITEELQRFISSISSKYGNIVEIVDLESGLVRINTYDEDKT